MAEQFHASLRYLRQSPRKVRLLAHSLVGLTVADAEGRLSASVKGAALPLQKLLRSAAANALEQGRFAKESLKITTLTVDGGPTIKRFRPRAFGRAAPIRKRTSHIIVLLTPVEGAERVTTGTPAPKAATKSITPSREESVKEETSAQAERPLKKSGDENLSKGPAGKGFMRRFFQRKSGM